MSAKTLDLSAFPDENQAAILKKLDGHDIYIGANYVRAFSPDGTLLEDHVLGDIAGIIRQKNPPGHYLATSKQDGNTDNDQGEVFKTSPDLNAVVQDIQRNRYGTTSDEENLKALQDGSIWAKRSGAA